MRDLDLAAIRERANCPAAAYAARVGEREDCVWHLVEHDVPDLLAEVDRLRVGISRLHRRIEERHSSLPRDEADSLARNDLRDLLGQTEGDRDE